MISASTEQPRQDWLVLYEAYWGQVPDAVAEAMAAEIRRLNPTQGQVLQAIRNLGAADHTNRMKPRAGEIIRELRGMIAGAQTTTRDQCACDGSGWVEIHDSTLERVTGQVRVPSYGRNAAFRVFCPNCQKGREARDKEIERQGGDADSVMPWEFIRRLWSEEMVHLAAERGGK